MENKEGGSSFFVTKKSETKRWAYGSERGARDVEKSRLGPTIRIGF